MLDLTIILPTLNTCADVNQDVKIRYAFRQCLLSLQETVPEIPILVVSNNGDPRSLPIETEDKVKRINLWEQGQCKAVNAAVAITNTEWIMVSNDDMIYPPGWLNKLVGGLNNSKCISPQLVEPIDGAPTFIKYPCGGAGGDFKKSRFLAFAKDHVGKGLKTGFNLPFLIKKELWDLVEGYDINYDPWGSNSDSDLEYKIRLAGIQPMQNTSCMIYHFSQTSNTQHPINRSHWQKNWDYFIKKWGFPRTDEGIWEANFEMPKPPIRKFCPIWEGVYG